MVRAGRHQRRERHRCCLIKATSGLDFLPGGRNRILTTGSSPMTYATLLVNIESGQLISLTQATSAGTGGGMASRGSKKSSTRR